MRILLSIKNKLLYLLITLIGGTFSCAMKYGAPTADYNFNGKVSDSLDQPIKNIAVIIHQNDYQVDSIVTDQNGNYSSSGYLDPENNLLWKMEM